MRVEVSQAGVAQYWLAYRTCDTRVADLGKIKICNLSLKDHVGDGGF